MEEYFEEEVLDIDGQMQALFTKREQIFAEITRLKTLRGIADTIESEFTRMFGIPHYTAAFYVFSLTRNGDLCIVQGWCNYTELEGEYKHLLNFKLNAIVTYEEELSEIGRELLSLTMVKLGIRRVPRKKLALEYKERKALPFIRRKALTYEKR